jgi:hypothetical protein
MKTKHFISVVMVLLLAAFSPQLRAEDQDHMEDKKTDSHKEHGSEKDDEHEHKDGKKHEDDEKDEHGHGEEEESIGGVGKGNAVTAADEHEGIQLSVKSQNAIGLKSESYQNGCVPVTALVRHQNEVSVYRLRNGWYKRVSVKVEKIENGQAVIQTDELSQGDFVVVQSVALLRVAELDAFSGEVGHSH